MTMAALAQAPAAASSPFRLDDERAWRDWRARKLGGYPAGVADLVVEVGDPRALTRAEHAAIARTARDRVLACARR